MEYRDSMNQLLSSKLFLTGRPIMKRIIFYALTFYTVWMSPVVADEVGGADESISLSALFPKEALHSLLLPKSEWQPLARVRDRDLWKTVPQTAQEALLKQADSFLNKEVPGLPATLYLEFNRNGNRSHYQNVWYDRHNMLHTLVLGECFEDKGRYLDAITNCLWAICEESSWTWPAHIDRQKAGFGLPDTTEPVVALFSAETASSLAWTVYLLKDRLDTVSPLICERVTREIDQRILTPYLERDNFGWMAFGARTKENRPNNWNPWINSNVLAAALLVEKNQDRRVELVHKVLRCVDNWLVPHPADGSCDEGPGYWGRAGASLFDILDLLFRATDGRLDVFEKALIKEIGQFIYRAHIADDYFVVVGDCDARIGINRDLVYRYGQRIQDPLMQALALADMNRADLVDYSGGYFSLGRTLFALFNLPNLIEAPTATAPFLRDVWLGDPELQLMTARDRQGSARGFYLACWAGHNGQSHNHNDVGNFVIYMDGFPFIIDVGRPTYTRQTFSHDRYKIWAMQSAYHNLPTINGFQQKDGHQYLARDVHYRVGEGLAELSMDIAPSYPKQAGIQAWKRQVRLVRERAVEVRDSFQLNQKTNQVVQHLFTPCKVTQSGTTLILSHPQTNLSLHIQYDPSVLMVKIETMAIKDGKLKQTWGPELQRILLTNVSDAPQQDWTVSFKKGREQQ